MEKNNNNSMIRDGAARARAGDRQAFCELYGIYKDRLYRYALYKLRDTYQAEDAVSETVLAAWKGIASLSSDDAFGSWIFAILRNQCNMILRKEIRNREKIEAACSDYDVSATVTHDPLLSMELTEALDQLSDEDKQIVLLSVVAGLNSKEISVIMGLKHATTRSRLSRSLSKMRDFLS